jgi:tetraacyldisaccharide 4'-kinase
MPGLAQHLQRAWMRRGPLAWALLPLAALFGAIGALRRTLYRTGLLPSTRLPVPVVVVGNIVAGGAGKTPTVLAVLELLRRHGRRPGVVSRGYGGAERGVLEVEPATDAARSGDEPLLLRRRGNVPVVVGRDRVAAGRELLRRHPEVDILVADDGLQHLRLARDAQVVVFDERGAGNGWLLPAGPLREPLPQRMPARTVLLYNATAPTTPLPGALARGRLAGVVALADWWRGALPDPAALAALHGRPVLAAAGIARPERFFALLRAAGVDVQPLALDDHHDYAQLPWPPGTPDVVVTEKDAVKLDLTRVAPTQVWVAALDFAPEPAFETDLLRLLGSAPTPPTRHGNPPA